MIEFIKAPEDVLAVKVTGAITDTDVEAVMDELEDVLARHDTIHVYVESHGFHGIALSALPHYLARAVPLLGKLRRFGRVAVVADQAWVRIATRIESAILPGITYRVFEPRERAEALDFALGKEKVAA